MKLKLIEASLAIALVFTVLFSALALSEQEALSEKLVRLHVVANSDSEEDQELKLAVRDTVLEAAGEFLSPSRSAGEARQMLTDHLPAIESAAEQVVRQSGFDYEVTASLSSTDFPEKNYDSFSLPAGNYTSLTVRIGEAEGKNWWCVVFPPLCVAAAADIEDTAAASGLTDDEIGLITEEEGYVLKFKSLEVFSYLKSLFD